MASELQLLTPSEMAMARRAFLVFDRNSDGIIDISELRASLVTLGHPEPSDAALRVIVSSLDKDGSGGIEFEEFLQVIQQHKGQQVGRGGEADTLEAFVAMGGQPDASGSVAVERLQRVITQFELAIDLPALLESWDKDADGSVSYSEFKELLASGEH